VSARDTDRGLHAVGRVREVRERDSRLGLRSAILEHQALEDRAAALDDVVRSHAAGTTTTAVATVAATDWTSQRAALVAVAAVARQARAESDAARVRRTAADEHWRLDRTRLRAVELLLERRAEERRAEAQRVAERELDDIGGQLWLRRSREVQR
jgi:flagellar protein FliJ